MPSASCHLSPMQAGMLFHNAQDPMAGVDIEQLVCSLREPVEVDSLRTACVNLVARHAVLRTSFQWRSLDEPQQTVHDRVDVPFQVNDLAQINPEARARHVERFLEQDRASGFSLDRTPLCRFSLLKFDSSDYKLIFTFHHVVMDGRSFPVVLNELFAEYDALRAGTAIEFPPERPYSEYISWLHTRDLIQAERFWRQYLGGFVLPNQVPALDPLNAVESGRGEEEVVLSAESTEALRALAEREQVTLNTVVQGVWALMISRYSGTGDVVFGAIRACRGFASDTAGMVGTFINTLPIRIRVEGSERIANWLRGIRGSQVEIREYEHTPLVSVQSWSELPPATPLFESILVFDNYELNTRMQSQGGNWTHRDVHLRERTNFPLALYGYAENSLILRLAYDKERFNGASARRMMGHMRTLLEALPAASGATLDELPMMTAEECSQLRQWNETKSDYPATTTVHDLIEEQVDRSPDALSVVFRDERLSYRELDNRANQLAHLLRSKGLQPGERVAVSMERSLELMIALLATLKAGGTYVPLDPTYPAERIKYVLADAHASIVITQEKLRPQVEVFARAVIAVDSDAEYEVIEQCSESRPRVPMPSDSPAYVIYTSGSTGKPKGVVVNHRNVVNFFTGMDQHFGEDSPGVWLAVTSISFDISVFELFWTLAHGYCVVLLGDNEFLPANPDAVSPKQMGYSIPEQILRHGVTHLQCTPSLGRLLLGDPMGRQALGALRKFVVGGEALPLSLAAEWQQAGVGEVYNGYGPTETTIYSTMEKLPPRVKDISIGRPIVNTSVFVLDANRRQVPVGVAGELYIGGEGVVSGYLDRPELTAERFVRLDFCGQRAYRTGDLVKYLPDGRLAFLGRVDHQVKIRGQRIEMGEIEAALAQHPAVQEAIVAVVENQAGDPALVAYLVGRAGAGPEPADLRSFLAKQLPSYMVPGAYVLLDAFPRTPNGKIDRKRLPRPELAPQERLMVPPRNPVEEQLSKIWRETLSISEIGMHDNFFELGGQSLLALQLFSRIKRHFGVDLPLATLYRTPTVESMAAIVAEGGRSDFGATLVPINPNGTRPPLYCAAGVGGGVLVYRDLAVRLPSDQPFYALQPNREADDGGLLISVPEIAARYIEAVRAVQPEGPYFLSGYSFGGLVAFEMAQQLREAGCQIAFLGLFDTWAPLRVKSSQDWLARRTYGTAWQRIREIVTSHDAGDKIRDILRWRWKRLRARIAATLHLRHAAELETVIGSQGFAGMDYVGKPYSGSITLFRSQVRAEKELWSYTLGWENLVSDIIVRDVPGDHLSIYSGENIGTLAGILVSCLESARSPYREPSEALSIPLEETQNAL